MRPDRKRVVAEMEGTVVAFKTESAREEIYRSLIEGDNIIITVNNWGKITSISPTIEQLTGYANKEVTGQRFTKFVYHQDIGRVRESMARACKGNRTTVEFRVKCKDKDIRYARATAVADIADGMV
ncbi:MAG: PAS domain S-box protein, partial [Desulfotomaculaceae bacterium]|nr:PAS domain S-box protein [Desulfotomaculaceae bacterium]